jgi:hypothetical protein
MSTMCFFSIGKKKLLLHGDIEIQEKNSEIFSYLIQERSGKILLPKLREIRKDCLTWRERKKYFTWRSNSNSVLAGKDITHLQHNTTLKTCGTPKYILSVFKKQFNIFKGHRREISKSRICHE